MVCKDMCIFFTKVTFSVHLKMVDIQINRERPTCDFSLRTFSLTIFVMTFNISQVNTLLIKVP